MTKSAKVVFSLPIGLTIGGANTWSLQLAGQLARAGRPAVLVEHTCVDWHPRLDIPMPDGVRLVSCPGPKVVEAGADAVGPYRKVYESLLPAVVIPNYGAAIYAACAALSRDHGERIRVIGVAHGHSELYLSGLEYYEPIIHAFLAPNAEMERELRRRLPNRSDDIVMRPCAVDVPPRLDRTWSRAGSPLRIVYAGRITNHEKRVSNLSRLAARLGERGVDFELRVIGEGGYKPALVREMNALGDGVSSRVRVDGMRAPGQMPAVWREADVGILVSDTESGGIALLEAMAGGAVPVSTRCPGPEHLIRDGETGFLVPMGDMDAMADVLAALSSRRERLEPVGVRAHAAARESYSYESYMPWFERLLDRAWSQPPRCWDGRPLLPPAASHGRSWFRRLAGSVSSFAGRLRTLSC